jgi:hypothetical protein
LKALKQSFKAKIETLKKRCFKALKQNLGFRFLKALKLFKALYFYGKVL